MSEDARVIVVHADSVVAASLTRRIRMSGLATLTIVLAEVMDRHFRAMDMIARIPDIALLPPMISPESPVGQKDYIGARHFPMSNSANYRIQQAALSSHYNNAAKWRSGAHNAGHRGHENRHAERQRNWAALQNNR